MPSGSVTCLGVKPRFLAYAGYAISRSVPIDLYQCFQSIAISGDIDRYWEGLTAVAEQSCSSSRSLIPQS